MHPRTVEVRDASYERDRGRARIHNYGKPVQESWFKSVHSTVESFIFHKVMPSTLKSQSPVNFPQRIPFLILCRVATVKFLADPDTDEACTKIGFVPLPSTDLDYAHDRGLCG
ncbi:hypothetical protein SADUNF_Sadunf04G0032300 [Salix dunnii]|uniref:Uncharacterized protein n=1 Tax=Salix dunnii TaxID=1413687 RepID=A0A835N075_9ROSI|nr:hypothetical protein SADUNF_Sadunf04G0032300 [Salix dunnii]